MEIKLKGTKSDRERSWIKRQTVRSIHTSEQMIKMDFDELYEQACNDMDYHLRSVNSSMSEEAINEDVINGIDYAIECLTDQHDQQLTEEDEERIRTLLEEEYHWHHVLRAVFDFTIDLDENQDICVWKDDEVSGGGDWITLDDHCARCYHSYEDCDCYCKECGVNTNDCSC